MTKLSMTKKFKPLWQVMVDAAAPHNPPRKRMEAMIIALTNTILPEELEPPCGEQEPWPQAYQQMSDAKWEQRQQLRQLLLDEAAKALTDN